MQYLFTNSYFSMEPFLQPIEPSRKKCGIEFDFVSSCIDVSQRIVSSNVRRHHQRMTMIMNLKPVKFDRSSAVYHTNRIYIFRCRSKNLIRNNIRRRKLMIEIRQRVSCPCPLNTSFRLNDSHRPDSKRTSHRSVCDFRVTQCFATWNYIRCILSHAEQHILMLTTVVVVVVVVYEFCFQYTACQISFIRETREFNMCVYALLCRMCVLCLHAPKIY